MNQPTAEFPDPCDAKTLEFKKARHLPSRQPANAFTENAACNDVPLLGYFYKLEV